MEAVRGSCVAREPPAPRGRKSSPIRRFEAIPFAELALVLADHLDAGSAE
jgi:hypothetical protein